MAEDVEMYFPPINTSKIPLHGEQLEQLLQLNAGRRLQTSKTHAKLHIKLSKKAIIRRQENDWSQPSGGSCEGGKFSTHSETPSWAETECSFRKY